MLICSNANAHGDESWLQRRREDRIVAAQQNWLICWFIQFNAHTNGCEFFEFSKSNEDAKQMKESLATTKGRKKLQRIEQW